MLTDRKAKILETVILSYIQDPAPVGSKRLLELAPLSVSSATVRHELSELEQLGFITHPHTSAGRIPTDLGYRYFVDHLLRNNEPNQLNEVQQALTSQHHSVDDFLKCVAKIISVCTQQMGVVTFPAVTDLQFRSINFVPLKGNRVLVIWTTMSGVVKEQILQFKSTITKEELTKISNFMNQEMMGLSFYQLKDHVEKRRVQAESSYQTLFDLVNQIIESNEDGFSEKKICVDGMGYLLDKPEFGEASSLRSLFNLMEDRDQMLTLFDNQNDSKEIQVTIGNEHKEKSLWDYSVIQQNYVVGDQIVGTVSVLGPKRVPYSNIINVVNEVTGVVSGTLDEYLF